MKSKTVDGATYDALYNAVLLEYKRLEYNTFCEKQKLYQALPFWKKWFCQKPYESLSAYQYAYRDAHGYPSLNKKYKNKLRKK